MLEATVTKQPICKVSFSVPASYWQRWPLRIIGFGVLLLSVGRMRNLVRYFGVYWNVGAFTLSQRPITTPNAAKRDI